MPAFTYILYSINLDRYYIGSTQLSPEKRLELHLQKYYGANKFTAKTDDWKLFFSIPCQSLIQARKIENYLKRMRNRKYLEWLVKEPDAIERIKEKFR